MATAQYGPRPTQPTITVTQTYTWPQLVPYVTAGKLSAADAMAVVNGTATDAQYAAANALVGADPNAPVSAKTVHAKMIENGTGQNPGPGSGSGGTGSGGSDPFSGTPGDTGDPNAPPSSGAGDTGGGGAPVYPPGTPPAGAPLPDYLPPATITPSGFGVTDAIRYGIPTLGNVVSSLIQADAQGNATAAQQKYLEEALAYEKQRDAAAIALEGSRYANYSGNIAPYLATGNSANTRMASLLGLPPTTTSTAQPSAPTATFTAAPGKQGTVVPPGSPPFVQGGPVPPQYRTGTPATPTPPIGQLITMKAPDGSTKQVPSEQVAHYTSLGATVVN